jgi:hypothetical protein
MILIGRLFSAMNKQSFISICAADAGIDCGLNNEFIDELV